MAMSSHPTTPPHNHTHACISLPPPPHTHIHTNSCQEQVEGNVTELVTKMLDAEKDEWNEMQPPEQDVDGAYYTTIGITLFQMIEQNVSRSTLA